MTSIESTGLARTLRVFAPAKINWVLAVERRREDGFHDIHTIFQALAWGDELYCQPHDAPECLIECNDPAVPTGPDNLVARAWRRLAEAFPERVGGLRVQLLKRVPAGAGLGGGSSDAAAALLAVDELYRLGLPIEELERHAAALGSDCAFFVRGAVALGSGRGERLEPLVSHLPPVWLVVVYPGFTSPTAEAYGRLRPEHWEGPEAARRVAQALGRGDLAALQAAARNIFGELALAADERYRLLRDRLLEAGLAQPMLSGSGSAMFAFAHDEPQAREACQRLLRDYPLAVATQPQRTGVGFIAHL